MLTVFNWVITVLLIWAIPTFFFLNVLVPFFAVFMAVSTMDLVFSSNPVVSMNPLGRLLYLWGIAFWLATGGLAMVTYVIIGASIPWN